ncbi:hypothetical protein [Chryseobacterium sp.]|uniref:hypothetical protein n=1 Tax=Chryseobacterium sp. TaxID=1871047 RepID=UPI0011C9D843|nr:hypothetical protein [Chryseobacterium sp.]TXF76334.1 hypothetical protein FUA25_10645 [Chryseobacterium sp.]
MKNYLTIFLLAIFSIAAVSCTDRNDEVIVEDNPVLMRDVTGTLNSTNSYTLTQGIDIATSDVVLVYRNINSNTTASAVWQLLPKTEFLSAGRELDYNFLFDATAIEIYTESNFDQTTMTAAEANKYQNNQRFRIVLIPASAGRNANVDYNDYQSVIKFYNIKDKN